MDKVAEASRLFRSGCACSQAVLAAFADDLGLPRDMAMKIAAGFAGGMRMAETCGAVTGAFMVLGLRHGSEQCDGAEGRTEVYAQAIEFVRRFRDKHGSITCRELLEVNIITPEGYRQAQEQNLFQTKCVKFVEDAAAILREMRP